MVRIVSMGMFDSGEKIRKGVYGWGMEPAGLEESRKAEKRRKKLERERRKARLKALAEYYQNQ